MSCDVNNENAWNWHTTFVGAFMQHNFRLYYILDEVLTNNRLTKIVEIGTGHGALTIFLGLWGIKLNISVFSIDAIKKFDEVLFKKLNIDFCQGDEFDIKTINRIKEFVGKESVLFICDGGGKKQEFNTYVPHLGSGSIIGIHDWGIECKMEDIKSIANEHCDIYKPDRWNEMNAQFAMFRKK